MRIDAFLIVAAVQLLDPFKTLPLIAVSYYAKSRWTAIATGAGIVALVSMATSGLLHTPSEAAQLYLLASIVVGVTLPAVLWGPMSRWRTRREGMKPPAPPQPPAP